MESKKISKAIKIFFAFCLIFQGLGFLWYGKIITTPFPLLLLVSLFVSILISCKRSYSLSFIYLSGIVSSLYFIYTIIIIGSYAIIPYGILYIIEFILFFFLLICSIKREV